MKKIYFFLSLLLITGLTIEAQELKPNGFPQAILKPGTKKIQTNNKAYGAVLYSEDFDSTGNAVRNGLPLGWTLQNFSGNNFNWIWSNSAPGGQYSAGVGPLQSTTGSNGFLLLPSDLYNTPLALPVAMNASVTSPQINITATKDVAIRFEQHYRYCCSATDELVMEVSNDGIAWTTFDVTLGRPPSTGVANPERLEFDVSNVLSNQTTAFVRFRQTGASHFYFMVDDLEIIEGRPADYIAIEDYKLDLGSNFIYEPNFTMIPQDLTFGSVPPSFDVMSTTFALAQSNVKTSVEVIHVSDCNAMPGQGLVYSQIDSSKTFIPAMNKDTFRFNNFTSFQSLIGKFRFNYQVESDSTKSANILNKAVDSLIITDTTYARDNGIFTGGTGPSDFVGGGNMGDRMGALYSIYGQGFGIMTTSISIFVANDSQNIGTAIQPRVWAFDETKSTLDSAISNSPVGSTPFTTTITAPDLGQWITLPLFPPVRLSGSAQYVVGWEQVNALPGKNFIAGRDLTMEPNVPAVTNFIYTNTSSPAWGWVSRVAGVRLNFRGWFPGAGCQIVGQEELTLKNESSLEIFPNPNKGQFALRFKSQTAKNYTLKVRNNLGQIILEEQVAIRGYFAKAIDLSQYESGIYFLSLENGQERYVEKIVVQ